MAKKKSAHGGKREGSGRKPKYDEPVRVKGVKLPESLAQWAESQPDKTFSELVVELLTAAKRRSERK